MDGGKRMYGWRERGMDVKGEGRVEGREWRHRMNDSGGDDQGRDGYRVDSRNV